LSSVKLALPVSCLADALPSLETAPTFAGVICGEIVMPAGQWWLG
jgi:hypothetical protein